jgi:hypothetical protein
MQQYLQRLEGHLDEARLVVDRFKDAAAQSGMSLDQLSPARPRTPTRPWESSAASSARPRPRVDELGAADTALRHASAWTRPFVFLRAHGREHRQGDLAIYRPAVPTTPRASSMPAFGIVFVLALYHLASGGRSPAAFRPEGRGRAGVSGNPG